MQRFEALVEDLRVEVDVLKDRAWPDLSEPTEELFDLFHGVVSGAIRTNSDAQRRRFARILAIGASERRWSEAQEAAQLLSELSDLHILVLRAAASAPPSPDRLGGEQLVSLVDPDREGAADYAKELPYLPQLLPGASRMLITKVCADLTSRGLLHDEGAGRYNGQNMDLFSITDFGEWFVGWVADAGSSKPREA